MLQALAACGLLIVARPMCAAGVTGPVLQQVLDAIRPAAAKPGPCDDKPMDLCRARQGLAPRRRR